MHMLDRRYIVPEVQDHSEQTEAVGNDPNDLSNPVDACLDRLEVVRSQLSLPSSPQSSLELELESLFLNSDSRVATEMERIAIILCRIAHRIIRAETLSETDYSTLLQIFELGLFLAQFKDRWLSHLKKTRIIQENKWVTEKEFVTPGPLLSSARELMSLAQEYILRQTAITGNRCDLCAYALANIGGIYTPSLTLLLNSNTKKLETEENREETEMYDDSLVLNADVKQLPLDYFYFLLYSLTDTAQEKAKILTKWVTEMGDTLDLTLLYLPSINILEYCKLEMQKIRSIDDAIEIVRAANSHAIMHSASIIINSHRKGKLPTKELSEILINTYTKENYQYTIQILQNIAKYSPVAAESLTKSLIIIGGATELAPYFFKTSFIIDRDYAETSIICAEQIDCIPQEMLRLLCDSDYFKLLCEEKKVFKEIVRVISEICKNKSVSIKSGETTIKTDWDIRKFCGRVFSVQKITIDSLEKGLLLMLYFPDMSLSIKRIVWGEIEKKGAYMVSEHVDRLISAIYMSNGLDIKKNNAEKDQRTPISIDRTRFSKCVSDEIDHVVDVLNHYREVPSIQRQLLKLAKCLGVFSILLTSDPDMFTIKCIRMEIKRLKPEIQKLQEFLMQLKERNELHQDTHWFIQAKKQVSLGNSIRSLNSIMMQDDILYLLNNEEDIVYLLRLISKRSVPDISMASCLVEKLEIDCLEEEGLVLGNKSSISVSLPNKTKTLTAYLMLTQKEFVGRQSVLKAIDTHSEVEVFIRDGVLMTRYKKVLKNKNNTVEEVERKAEYTSDKSTSNISSIINSRTGWSLSMGITLSSKQCKLVIGDVSINIPHGIKPTELVIGEEFKGVLKKALILEESYKSDRISSRPTDVYYIENLIPIERACQYYNRFGLFINSTTPYHINGSSKVRMINVFKSVGSQWRVSERLCRYISKLSAKHYQIEEILHSNILPPNTLTDYLTK
ncbi:hypothetical protein NEIRO03_1901 [Nematocida sp. AWRm78]|nr:hypothetical protein NEIRO02_1907 [Nematocida sp. AWRm79]KAI5185019.1 hypothetical protein NEIRO03_1901 [Nematocida sp. AWRm78]